VWNFIFCTKTFAPYLDFSATVIYIIHPIKQYEAAVEFFNGMMMVEYHIRPDGRLDMAGKYRLGYGIDVIYIKFRKRMYLGVFPTFRTRAKMPSLVGADVKIFRIFKNLEIFFNPRH